MMVRVKRSATAAMGAILAMLGTAILPASAQKLPPNELVQQVVANELKADKDDTTLWTYIMQRRKSGKTELRRVVETRQGDVSRLLSVNGTQLSGQSQQRETQRIQKLTHDSAAIEKEKRSEQEDDKKARELLNAIQQAFVFSYTETRGNTLQLSFRPNPDFKPQSHEAQVLHSMAGTMLVDSREKRLIGLSGTMVKEVDFGGGILGKLQKGGTFALRRREVAPGIWRDIVIDVHLKGKALLFKTIGEQQEEKHSEFRRLSDKLNLAQAAQILAPEKGGRLSAAGPQP